MNLPTPSQPTAPTPDDALRSALAGLMDSVAKLAVAKGLPFDAVQTLLKQSFVEAASRAHPGLPEHRKVSRISTSTGINRRDVARVMQDLAGAGQGGDQPGSGSRSAANQLFTRWRTQPEYQAAEGEPRTVPRLGPAPSFEALAHSVTRDVHPRSLLDELCRLGLASWDQDADSVQVVREPFVPHGDQARLLAFLGDNVGDHLQAAVSNVLGDGSRHFEQAVFADGLSAASIDAVRPAIAGQWRALMAALVPALEQAVAKDALQAETATGRLRVGLFSYFEGAEPAIGAPAAPELPLRAPARAKSVLPKAATVRRKNVPRP